MATNSTNGNDTIGAATIVDRVEGWGHTAGSVTARKDNATWGNAAGNTITATDASKESTDDRADRLLKARKSFVETVDPTIADRTHGRGGAYDETAGADNGYRTSGPDAIWDAENFSLANSADYANGVFYDANDSAVAGTGSNTEFDETTDSEFLASGRTSKALPTSAVAAHRSELPVVGTDYTVGSIVDRTANWGHTAGSESDRKD